MSQPFDKGRKKEKKEKKFSDSMPRHFPEEMAEAKRTLMQSSLFSLTEEKS